MWDAFNNQDVRFLMHHAVINIRLNSLQLSNIAFRNEIANVNACLNQLLATSRSTSSAVWELVTQVGIVNGKLIEISEMIANPSATRSQEFLRRGSRALSKGWLAESLTDFENALQGDPYNAATHYFKGLALAQLGEFEQALASFDSAEKYAGDLWSFSSIQASEQRGLVNLAHLKAAQFGLEASMKKFAIHLATTNQTHAVEELKQSLSVHPVLRNRFEPPSDSHYGIFQYPIKTLDDVYYNASFDQSSKQAWPPTIRIQGFVCSYDELENPPLPQAFKTLLSAQTLLALWQGDSRRLREIFEVDPSIARDFQLVEGTDFAIVEIALTEAINTVASGVIDSLRSDAKSYGRTQEHFELLETTSVSGNESFDDVIQVRDAISTKAKDSIPVDPTKPNELKRDITKKRSTFNVCLRLLLGVPYGITSIVVAITRFPDGVLSGLPFVLFSYLMLKPLVITPKMRRTQKDYENRMINYSSQIARNLEMKRKSKEFLKHLELRPAKVIELNES